MLPSLTVPGEAAGEGYVPHPNTALESIPDGRATVGPLAGTRAAPILIEDAESPFDTKDLIHTARRPRQTVIAWHCHRCPAVFAEAPELDEHILVVHGLNHKPGEQRMGSFQCPSCDHRSQFRGKMGCLDHLIAYHQHSVVSCPLCIFKDAAQNQFSALPGPYCVTEHFSRTHSCKIGKLEAAMKSLEESDLWGTTRCLICQFTAKKVELIRHLVEVHGNSFRGELASSIVRRVRIRSVSLCHYCGERHPGPMKHLQKAHPLENRALRLVSDCCKIYKASSDSSRPIFAVSCLFCEQKYIGAARSAFITSLRLQFSRSILVN